MEAIAFPSPRFQKREILRNLDLCCFVYLNALSWEARRMSSFPREFETSRRCSWVGLHPLRGLSGPFRASDLGNWLESSLPFCFLCCFFLESLSCGCRTFSIHLIFLFPPPPSFYIILSFRSSFWEIFPSFILQLFYCIFRFFR